MEIGLVILKIIVKKVWETQNDLLGRNTHYTFLEVEGNFPTKPTEIANYFSNYFICKVDKLKNNMPSVDIDNHISSLIIKTKL